MTLLDAVVLILGVVVAPFLAPALIIQAIHRRGWPWICGAGLAALPYLAFAWGAATSEDPKAWMLFAPTLWLPVAGLVVALVGLWQGRASGGRASRS